MIGKVNRIGSLLPGLGQNQKQLLIGIAELVNYLIYDSQNIFSLDNFILLAFGQGILCQLYCLPV